MSSYLIQTKKILIVLCFFIFIKSVQAQSPFSIIPTNTITSTVDCDTEKELHFYVANPNETDLLLQWKVKSNTLPPAVESSGSGGCWGYRFCDWQYCIFELPAVDLIVSRAPIKPKSDLNDFKLAVLPGNIKGIGTLVIEVFEKNFPSNSKTLIWNVTGCATGAECSFVGISEFKNNADFTVYPNPAADFVNVEIINGYTKNGSLQVYNLVGEKLIELNDLNDTFQKIDLSKLPAGGYFIKYNSGSGSSVKKIFKTK